MSQAIPLPVVVLKTVTLVLGGSITYLAYKAFRRTEIPGLRWLAIGFGAVTLGSFLAGVADLLLGLEAAMALTIESALTAAGFGIILYSLFETQAALQ